MKTAIALVLIVSLITVFVFWRKTYYNGPVSDHFNGKVFFDPHHNNDKNFWDFLTWQWTKKTQKWPESIAVQQYDVPPERVMGDELRVSYVGHVTFLIQTQGMNLLTDPVWSERASPVRFAGPKRVIDPGIRFDDLPPIDVVWISHNHYDHLDVATIKRLWDKHKPRIVTPLGNDAIIHAFDDQIHVETLDWGDQLIVSPELTLHALPMQHWSARGLLDRNKALWAALNIDTPGGHIYFVGDSGYGDGRYFQQAKEKFGAFRLALLPMGAYEPRWFMKFAHMNPSDMLKAHKDLGQPLTIPSHFDVFQLTDEGWGEAAVALQNAKAEQQLGENVMVLPVGGSVDVPKS